MTGPYDELEQIFHQPRRLEIMAELCGAKEERSFNELKDSCSLTDGNLSRHLQMLEKAGVVKIKKSFADSKPLTTVSATKKGRESFLAYLSALESVLLETAKRVGAEQGQKRTVLPKSLKALRS